jgi:integrase/recombinase XerC
MTIATIPTYHKHIRPSHASPKVIASPVTFGAWLNTEGVPGTTGKSYQSDLAVLTAWYEEHNRPEKFDARLLSSSDIRAWRHHALEVAGWAPASWNRRRAFVAVYSRYLRAQGINSTDLLRGVDRAKQQKEDAPRWIDQSKFHRLERWLEHAEDAAHTPRQKSMARRNVAMLALMAYAGLREFEVCKLRRSNIEIHERSGHVFVYGKGQKYGKVPLCSELRHYLSAFLDGADLPADAILFPIKERQLQNIVVEAGRDCQIDGLTPHMLRHCFGKKLDRANVPLPVAQQLMRHTNVKQTMRYQSPGEEELRAAVEAAAYADLPKGWD